MRPEPAKQGRRRHGTLVPPAATVIAVRPRPMAALDLSALREPGADAADTHGLLSASASAWADETPWSWTTTASSLTTALPQTPAEVEGLHPGEVVQLEREVRALHQRAEVALRLTKGLRRRRALGAATAQARTFTVQLDLLGAAEGCLGALAGAVPWKEWIVRLFRSALTLVYVVCGCLVGAAAALKAATTPGT